MIRHFAPSKVKILIANTVFLQGSNGKLSPVTWRSKKIKRIVERTLAAEALALDEPADACSI